MGTEQDASSQEQVAAGAAEEEKYNPDKAVSPMMTWEPSPAEIISLFESLAKGEIPELDWVCPGRRSPSPVGMETEEDMEDVGAIDDGPKEEKHIMPEFDFDDDVGDIPSVTPRRISGFSKTPKSQQKRVARLDNILSDMMRHKKMDRDRQKSPGTPRRPLPKLKIRKEGIAPVSEVPPAPVAAATVPAGLPASAPQPVAPPPSAPPHAAPHAAPPPVAPPAPAASVPPPPTAQSVPVPPHPSSDPPPPPAAPPPPSNPPPPVPPPPPPSEPPPASPPAPAPPEI